MILQHITRKLKLLSLGSCIWGISSCTVQTTEPTFASEHSVFISNALKTVCALTETQALEASTIVQGLITQLTNPSGIGAVSTAGLISQLQLTDGILQLVINNEIFPNICTNPLSGALNFTLVQQNQKTSKMLTAGPTFTGPYFQNAADYLTVFNTLFIEQLNKVNTATSVNNCVINNTEPVYTISGDTRTEPDPKNPGQTIEVPIVVAKKGISGQIQNCLTFPKDSFLGAINGDIKLEDKFNDPNEICLSPQTNGIFLQRNFNGNVVAPLYTLATAVDCPNKNTELICTDMTGYFQALNTYTGTNGTEIVALLSEAIAIITAFEMVDSTINCGAVTPTWPTSDSTVQVPPTFTISNSFFQDNGGPTSIHSGTLFTDITNTSTSSTYTCFISGSDSNQYSAFAPDFTAFPFAPLEPGETATYIASGLIESAEVGMSFSIFIQCTDVESGLVTNQAVVI